MKLVDYVCQRTGESKEYIVSLSCPSSFGSEYDKYEAGCEQHVGCAECWEQEMTEED